jgi:hypothetical protein
MCPYGQHEYRLLLLRLWLFLEKACKLIVILVGMPFYPSGFVFIGSANWDRCHHHSYWIAVILLFVFGVIFFPCWEIGFGVFNFVFIGWIFILYIYFVRKKLEWIDGIPPVQLMQENHYLKTVWCCLYVWLLLPSAGNESNWFTILLAKQPMQCCVPLLLI